MTAHVESLFTDTAVIEATAAKLAESLALLDAEIDQLDADLKAKKARREQMEEDLAGVLLSAGLQSVKLESGLQPQVTMRRKFFKASGVTDEQLHEWLRSVGLGGIIKEMVHFGTLQSTLKAHEEQGKEVPSDLIQTKDERGIRLNGKSRFLALRQ